MHKYVGNYPNYTLRIVKVLKFGYSTCLLTVVSTSISLSSSLILKVIIYKQYSNRLYIDYCLYFQLIVNMAQRTYRSTVIQWLYFARILYVQSVSHAMHDNVWLHTQYIAIVATRNDNHTCFLGAGPSIQNKTFVLHLFFINDLS